MRAITNGITWYTRGRFMAKELHQRTENHHSRAVVTSAVAKMISSAAWANCVCSREIWSMGNSMWALIVIRLIPSGSGPGSEKR